MYVAYGYWIASSPAGPPVRRHSGQAVQRQKQLYDQRAVRRLFAIGDWVMRYYPAGKKCKLDSVWTGPYLVVAFLGWTVGIQKHPDVPLILIHCQDVKKVPQPSGVQLWIAAHPPVGAPAVPMLGASTVAHTSRGSPSITALPPDEGVVLTDVDFVRNGRSTLHGRVSDHASAPSDDSQMALMTDSVSPTDNPFAATTLRSNNACALHPFSLHMLNAGPVRLMTIAHAFNYRMAVLRYGVKSAVRVRRSRKAEGLFLSGSDIPWGQQVAVMFQIVSTVALELPSFLADLENLRGITPNVHLHCEPWGHINHKDINCGCQSSYRTAAYVHDLTVNGRGCVPSPDVGVASLCYTRTNGHLCIEPSWETGLLVSSDWLRPVTRGGWRPAFRIEGVVRLTSAD